MDSVLFGSRIFNRAATSFQFHFMDSRELLREVEYYTLKKAFNSILWIPLLENMGLIEVVPTFNSILWIRTLALYRVLVVLAW